MTRRTATTVSDLRDIVVVVNTAQQQGRTTVRSLTILQRYGSPLAHRPTTVQVRNYATIANKQTLRTVSTRDVEPELKSRAPAPAPGIYFFGSGSRTFGPTKTKSYCFISTTHLPNKLCLLKENPNFRL